jgi:membrane protein implicated in regulation of membrane protease activity
MLWIMLGMLAMLAGMVIMVLGSTWIGLVLLLAGVGLMAFNYATMMRGRGQDPEQGLYNGLNGQGKQQSETVDVNMPEPGEQSPGIWEKMQK